MRTLALLLAAGVMGAAMPRDLTHGADPERTAILDAARGPTEQALAKPVRFKVRRLTVEGRWAFLLAAMQAPDGAPVSFAGTPKADAEREGLVSKDYAALLSHSDAGWSVVAQAVGPTDAAWSPWPAEYGAPADLFADAAR